MNLSNGSRKRCSNGRSSAFYRCRIGIRKYPGLAARRARVDFRMPVITMLLASVSCISCTVSEFDDNLGPVRFCESPAIGNSMDADLQFMRRHAASVEENAFGTYEADFNNNVDFVYVPTGIFQMGTNEWGSDEQPVHDVFLNGFWIGKNLVTNEQFAEFVNESEFVTDAEKPDAEGCYVFIARRNGEGGNWQPTPGWNWRNAFDDHPTDPYYRDFENLRQHPVGCVSWYDAMAYSEWLSAKLRLSVSLPTEAQWEKAARGTDGRAWPWGNEPPDETRSNFADASFDAAYEQPNQGVPTLSVDDGWSATSPVGLFPAGASPYGVLDMSGNTTQWVYDLLSPYSSEMQSNPMGPTGGADRSTRAMRGGFWIASASSLTPTPKEIRQKHTTRADLRAGDDPRSSDDHLGFRVVIDGCDRP